MFASRTLLIIGVFCITSALCKLCDFADTPCLTQAARRVFIQVVAGIPGVEPSDPLHLDYLETSLASLKYRLIDGYLTGMMGCDVELLMVSNNLTYDYHIRCPKLSLMSKYDMMAREPTQFIQSKGTCDIDLYAYTFLFHGFFEVMEGDMGKMHLRLMTHDLKFKPGNVTYRYKDLSTEGRDESETFKQYANKKWKSVVNRTIYPIMEAFMTKHIKNKNDFLALVPIQDLFHYENTDERYLRNIL